MSDEIKLKGHLRVSGVSWSALPDGNYRVEVTFAGGYLPERREFAPSERMEILKYAMESMERFFDDQVIYDAGGDSVVQ